MARVVRIRARGQMTLPKAIRDQLGLREGDEFLVETADEGLITLVALPKPRSVFDLGNLVDTHRGLADLHQARERGRRYRVQRRRERIQRSQPE